MEEGAFDDMTENENQANAQKIIRILKKNGRRMSHRDMVRSLQNSIRSCDLKELLQAMYESGQLAKQEIKSQRGPSSIWYKLQNWK